MAKKSRKEKMMMKHRQMRKMKHKKNFSDMNVSDEAMMVRGY